MNDNGNAALEALRIARENIARSRREFIERLGFLLKKGLQQSDHIDRALLTLSAGALLLSITFIGTLSETKHCLGLLFAAWGCFVVSIVAVIFGMWNALHNSHTSAVETAANFERFSEMDLAEASEQRVTFPVGTNKTVMWLNGIAILGFVIGVGFLCWFVGANLLSTKPTSS